MLPNIKIFFLLGEEKNSFFRTVIIVLSTLKTQHLFITATSYLTVSFKMMAERNTYLIKFVFH